MKLGCFLGFGPKFDQNFGKFYLPRYNLVINVPKTLGHSLKQFFSHGKAIFGRINKINEKFTLFGSNSQKTFVKSLLTQFKIKVYNLIRVLEFLTP
jgi:hypothetical protein